MTTRMKVNTKKGALYILLFVILLVHSWVSNNGSKQDASDNVNAQAGVYLAE